MDAPSPPHWCHSCSKHVSCTRNRDDELVCPACGGTFVEVVAEDTTSFVPFRPTSESTSTSTTTTTTTTHRQLPPGSIPASSTPTGAPPLNPIQAMLQRLAEHLQGRGGGAMNMPAMFSFGNNGGVGGFMFGGGGGAIDLSQLMNGMGVVGNPGDYAWGNQMESILESLFAQGGNRGPPPADTDAVSKLPRETIGPADVDAGEGKTSHNTKQYTHTHTHTPT
jgi:hypothetical protein